MRSRAYSAKPEQQTNGSVHIPKGLGQNRLTGGPKFRSCYLAIMGGITMKQHNKLLLGFALGVILGLIGYYNFPAKEFAAMGRVTELFTFVGATFLRMIFMVVVPLILSALMLGAMELGRGAGLGRVGGQGHRTRTS